VVGPRQVGKTTILQRFKPPVLIDEIQYAPELLPYIKIHIDQYHQAGAFWLTDSQQFQLMEGVSESLAGRVGIVNLLGLSLKEQQKKAEAAVPFLPIKSQLEMREKISPALGLSDVYQHIWRGSFPAMWISEIDRDLFYGSYIQTYLQRDIRDLANIGDLHAFLKFLRAAAARTGQLLNLSDMARDIGISTVTAKHWLSALEASGMVYLLEPYHNNVTKRLVKTPKLYFLDTGLCAYLTEWSSAETLEAGAMSGAILETFILSEILKSYWHNGKRAPIYYYRDKDKKEIDLLIVQNDVIYPLEFKKTANPGKNAIRHFQVIEKLGKKIGEGGVICLTQMLLPIAPGVNAIPVGYL